MAISSAVYLFTNLQEECEGGRAIHNDSDAIEAAKGRLIGLLSGFQEEAYFNNPERLFRIIDDCASCYSVKQVRSFLSKPIWRVEFDYKSSSGASYSAYITVGECSEIYETGKVKIN